MLDATDLPRWLDRDAAARHIGVRAGDLPRLLKRGKLPPPSLHLGPRSPRWDRLALDAMFDGNRVDTTQEAVDAAVQAILAEGPRRQKEARRRHG